MKLLNTCCFCISLKAGAIIIAVICLVVSGLILIGLSGILAVIEIYGRNKEDVRHYYNSLYAGEEFDWEANKETLSWTAYLIAVGLCLYFIFFVLCCLLLHGIRKESPCYILPWLGWTFVDIVLLIAAGILVKLADEASLELSMLLLWILIIIIVAYFYLVILSYYQSLKEDRSELSSYPLEIKVDS